MTPETKIRNQITRYLQSLKKAGEPIFFLKMHGGAMQRAGVPDFHVTYLGRSLWFEVKAGDNTATKLQQQVIIEINRAMGFAYVVYSLDEVKRMLDYTKITYRVSER